MISVYYAYIRIGLAIYISNIFPLLNDPAGLRLHSYLSSTTDYEIINCILYIFPVTKYDSTYF